jgi:uncharacterized protein (TIGR03437 family)
MKKFLLLFAAVLCGGGALAQAQQPQSWTSHDKLALTYFFYWYDATTNKNLTLHPPDSYLSTYTYNDIAFYQRELSDMAAAGIDVVLPVYWGDPGNVARWSVPGLRLMAQVEQAMAQAGQTAPKIGMFVDTSTSLAVANGGAPPDLTTAAGKSLFYSFFHTFFASVPQQFWARIDGRPIAVLYGGSSAFVSAYDQSTFDYIAQQFQQDFGTTPYVIRHFTWPGVTTDAMYAGWPTSFNANFAGDVASVSPGEDNYAVIAQEQKHIVTDRNCGDLYQADWDQVVAHGARLVLIEDWNELFEGSGISATKEYGRRYVDQTARNVARWKSSANTPSYSPPDTVWASLGPILYQFGLYTPFNYGGAAWLTTQIAGHDAMYPDHSWPSYYIYLAADDRFVPTRPANLWVTVEYLDTGGTPWRLEYDGVNNPFWATSAVASQNSGQWKLATFHLPDALFQMRGGEDVRIDDYNTQNQVHYFNRVWITKTAPTGQPPQLPITPDVSLPAGSTMDVPINAKDSSGKPLAVSLATAPGFATLQNSAGVQKIHLAPSLADLRTCSDVTGPGVTSTPAYHISVTANDPNSILGTGATSFSVLVTPPVPSVQRVTDSWNYTSGVAPGAWVTIWGTGLAVGAPQLWAVAGTALPTSLNSVTVLFNQTPAALVYVSSTMINALVPASLQPGPVQVVVQSNGVNSAPFTVTATATLPAIYAVPAADGATWFVTAALAGTATLIGNPAVDPRVSRAAQAGDVLDLYLIGLGATQDLSKFVTDRVFAGAFLVAAPVTATVGGAPAELLFAGLTSPGLYLVRIVVPSGLAPGPQPIQVSAGGSKTPTSLVLTVAPAP